MIIVIIQVHHLFKSILSIHWLIHVQIFFWYFIESVKLMYDYGLNEGDQIIPHTWEYTHYRCKKLALNEDGFLFLTKRHHEIYVSVPLSSHIVTHLAFWAKMLMIFLYSWANQSDLKRVHLTSRIFICLFNLRFAAMVCCVLKALTISTGL